MTNWTLLYILAALILVTFIVAVALGEKKPALALVWLVASLGLNAYCWTSGVVQGLAALFFVRYLFGFGLFQLIALGMITEEMYDFLKKKQTNYSG